MNNTFTERIGRRTLRRFLLFFFAILIIVFACLMHTNYSSKLSPKKIDTHEMYNGTQTELMGKYGIIHHSHSLFVTIKSIYSLYLPGPY